MTSPDPPMPWQNDSQTASSRLLPTGLVFSDTPSRLVAYLLDGLVIAPVVYVLLAVVGFDSSTISYGRFPDRNLYVIATLIGGVINAGYFVWFWSGGRRATPGQRVFGIQVANAFDGKPLTTSQAFTRWFVMGQWLGLGFALPFLAAAIASAVVVVLWELILLVSTIASQTKQGLHDRLAGSALVRPAGAGNRWAVGTIVLISVIAGLYALLALWVFSNIPWDRMPPNPYLDDYLRWMWPS